MRVLDLGGEAHTWIAQSVRPAQVVLLNLPAKTSTYERESGPEWLSVLDGDACSPPRELLDERFDLVYSNSVIEHVGGVHRRAALAQSVHEFGTHHWVQTPYRYFPVEPHWLFPGFQFLPVAVRFWLTARWPVGHSAGRRDRPHLWMRDVLEVELLSRAELRFHFPDSEILSERVLGMTKSLIATA
jgi:hypothetical protein